MLHWPDTLILSSVGAELNCWALRMMARRWCRCCCLKDISHRALEAWFISGLSSDMLQSSVEAGQMRWQHHSIQDKDYVDGGSHDGDRWWYGWALCTASVAFSTGDNGRQYNTWAPQSNSTQPQKSMQMFHQNPWKQSWICTRVEITVP